MDNPPLLYYRSQEQIEAYRRMPTLKKIRKLEMEMEFLYYVRLERVKLNRAKYKEKNI
jgi:hypothetical protein